MKKNYWIFAAAAVAFAACSNDDTITVNQGIEEANTINFRSFVENQTRATGITTSSLTSFNVIANIAGTTTENYFGASQGVAFTKDNTTTPVSYRSGETKYYWPSEGKLDFIAYAPTTGISCTDSTHFSVTPAATPSAQVDFVYGVVRNQDKSSNGNGVQLNFRHAMSDVVIQLKNTSSDKKVTVGDVSINYILPTGAFAPAFRTAAGSQSGFCTDGTDISNVTAASETGFYIAPGAWSASGTRTGYTQAANTTAYAAGTTTAVDLDDDMILVPQLLVNPGVYSAATADATYNGATITVQLKIQDAQNHYLAGTADAYVTAMWPLTAITWLPGHKYTYTLDLAGGGYFPTNQENTDENLDPILKNAEIFFLTPTVDAWIEATGIDVDNN